MTSSLSSSQLEAFATVARTLHFSRAAKELGLTQSALSQRVLNLEQDVGVPLLLRERSGVQLTEAGRKLLDYCTSRESLETELLADLRGASGGGALGPPAGSKKIELTGTLRVAGYSSIMRSVVMPAVHPLIENNPSLNFSFFSRETYDLPQMLRTKEADFVFTDSETSGSRLKAELLGFENYVLVAAASIGDQVLSVAQGIRPGRKSLVILDHDAEDRTSELFFKARGLQMAPFRRCFLDDIQGLIDGVRRGWGVGVVPLHLARGSEGIQILEEAGQFPVPVLLHYATRSVPSRLHDEVLRVLRQNVPRFLEPK